MCLLAFESFGLAIIDTGCPRTASGKIWLKAYTDSLSLKDRHSITCTASSHKFRFGDGKHYKSEKYVILPIYINGHRYELGVEVVDCDIPLLLSRETLHRANACIDIANDSIQILGESVPMITTTSGHICLRIGRSLNMDNSETKRIMNSILFTSPLSDVETVDIRKKVLKLHKQFAHPTAQRLKDLIKNSNMFEDKNSDIFKVVDDVTESCQICKKLKKRHHRLLLWLSH